MFSKLFNKSEIHKILVISLTNIGDVVLTFPVIDILKRDFPSAKLSVVIGPKARSLLEGNPHLAKVYIFDKRQAPLKSLALMRELRREHFDLVVDLRNTAIPAMIAPRHRTSFRVKKKDGQHMRAKHLRRLISVYDFGAAASEPRALSVPAGIKDGVTKVIDEKIGHGKRYVVVAPGAADPSKRWPEEGFAFVCDRLVAEDDLRIVFAGGEEDRPVGQRIAGLMRGPSLNLCGETTLMQLAEVLRHCCFAIVNDSAPMHLASYVNVPVVALFGPTDPRQYGPWGKNGCVIKNNSACPACADPKSPKGHTCLRAISQDEVLSAVKKFAAAH